MALIHPSVMFRQRRLRDSGRRCFVDTIYLFCDTSAGRVTLCRGSPSNRQAIHSRRPDLLWLAARASTPTAALLQLLHDISLQKPILVHFHSSLARARLTSRRSLPTTITRDQVDLFIRIGHIAGCAGFADLRARERLSMTAPSNQRWCTVLVLCVGRHGAIQLQRLAHAPSKRKLTVAPSEIFHRPTLAACLSRMGKLQRELVESRIVTDQSRGSRSTEGPPVARHSARCALPVDLLFEDDLGRLLRLGNRVEHLLSASAVEQITRVRRRLAAWVCCPHHSRCQPRLLSACHRRSAKDLSSFI